MTPPPGAELVGAGSFRDGPRGWAINTRHPLYKIFEAAGGPLQLMPYFVSSYFSAVNRLTQGVCDAHDITFQTRLAQRVDEGYE